MCRSDAKVVAKKTEECAPDSRNASRSPASDE